MPSAVTVTVSVPDSAPSETVSRNVSIAVPLSPPESRGAVKIAVDASAPVSVTGHGHRRVIDGEHRDVDARRARQGAVADAELEGKDLAAQAARQLRGHKGRQRAGRVTEGDERSGWDDLRPTEAQVFPGAPRASQGDAVLFVHRLVRPGVGYRRVGGNLPDAVVVLVGDIERACPIHRHPLRTPQAGTGGRADGTPEVLMLVTNRLDLDAELVAVGYRFR